MDCSAFRPSALLLIGPTSSGKTPLGDLIAERGLGAGKYVHFDFGAVLRSVVAGEHPDWLLSRDDIAFLEQVLYSGALLENDQFPIARTLLQHHLADQKTDRDTIVVLNGLPRHVGQAVAVDRILDIRMVVLLECSHESVLSRIGSNIGGDRSERQDDESDLIRRKLDLFRRRTMPLLEHYRTLGKRIVTIDVTMDMTPDQAWRILVGCVTE